jgi:riboflavin synthase
MFVLVEHQNGRHNMFTGIIESIGTVASVQKKDKSITLKISSGKKEFLVKKGGSVAIDGICLTVESITGNILSFTAVYETLQHTTLQDIRTGFKVNLERALCLSDRLDGHIVLGHVDGIGHIVSDQRFGEGIYRTIWIPREFRQFMVHKGSIAIDGISLTIAKRTKETVVISLIPSTFTKTTMSYKKEGQLVNIECDIFARYIHHQMKLYTNSQSENGDSISEKTPLNMDILKLMEKSGF